MATTEEEKAKKAKAAKAARAKAARAKAAREKAAKPAKTSPGSKKTHVATLLRNEQYFDGRTLFKKGVPTPIDAVTAAHLFAKEPKKFKVELIADVQKTSAAKAAANKAVKDAAGAKTGNGEGDGDGDKSGDGGGK